MFSKGELSVLHNTRRKFVKELLRNIGPNEAVEHYCSRVKESNSIAEKLEKRNLQPTADNAAAYLTDLIGVRIVVHFIGDVYEIAARIKEKYHIVEELDYITVPKGNGYRSLHLIVHVPVTDTKKFRYCTEIPVEIQIRTVAMDCWASLEHMMLYKRKPNRSTELAKEELRNCAGTLFLTDMRMEAIQSIIEKTELDQEELNHGEK